MWDLIVSVLDHCLSFYFVCVSPDAICEADSQILSANKYIALTLFFNRITRMVRLVDQAFVLSLHRPTTNLRHSHHGSDTNFSTDAVCHAVDR